jgi:DNA-binding transcriptional MerR regulator
MFKIGDFSKMGQVSIRTLRHYDELGLLKPAQIDQFTDYRFYTIDQLPRLNRILALKDLGLSLEQIRSVLSEDISAEQLHGMLMLKQAEIEQEVEENQRRLRRVRARLEQIEQEGHVSPYEVVLKQSPAQTVLALHRCVPQLDDMPHYRHTMYEAVYQALEHAGLERAGPELAIYHNGEYTEVEIEMEAALLIQPPATIPASLAPADRIYTLPATALLATVVHHGSLPQVIKAISALYAWIGTNGYVGCGPIREIHLFGSELEGGRHSQVTLEVQVPVEKVAY